MKLTNYNNKRNFEKTTEPVGKIKKQKTKKPRFVVQYHRATTNHYDFRFEDNGVLVSFAVPKGLPKEGEKHLAVHVEDHPIDYISFEGTIPKGEYGAGTVEIFDKGYIEPINSFKTGLKNGKLKFFLFGKNNVGKYNLIKMDEKNWLFIKDKDSKNNNQFQKSNKLKVSNQNKTQKKLSENNISPKHKVKNPFSSVSVKLCLLSKTVPKSRNFIFEIKYDGYRIVAFIDKKDVKLKTRNDKDFTDKFLGIKNSLQKLNNTMVLDGEIVVFDNNGKSDFGLLQNSIKNNKSNFYYVVFDVLAYNGKDLRNLPLKSRKIVLDEVLKTNQNIILCDYVKNNGNKVFEYAKKHNLEGIVAKNILSTYDNKRDENWQKIKCYLRQEFVIIGYSISEKNQLLSAIFVGYYANNDLFFIGKVGTGFSEQLKKELNEKFLKLKTNKINIKNSEKITQNIQFLKPKLVAEIQFSNITKDKKLRQASFVALREDKNPKNVVLEKNWN